MLWNAKWEMLCLQLSGFDPNAPIINGVTGYIPALMIASLIIYYMLRNHYQLTINLIAPIVPIFIYSHIVLTYGNLSQWMAYENWYTVGILRGIAGCLIGVLAYEVSLKYKINTRILMTSNLICLLLIVGLVLFRDAISYYDEILYPYVFGILIAGTYSKKKVTEGKIIGKMFIFGGKISYNIFLIHYAICYLLKYYYPDRGYLYTSIIYISIIILFGSGMQILLKWLRRFFINKK